MILPINWLSVIAGTIISLLLGMVWYSPAVFRTAWMRLSKVKPSADDLSKMHYTFLGAALVGFTLSFGMAWIVAVNKPLSFVAGMYKGLWPWLFFIVPTHFSGVLWEKKPFALFLIQAGYYATFLGLLGGLMALW
jgi:hypothetical protein